MAYHKVWRQQQLQFAETRGKIVFFDDKFRATARELSATSSWFCQDVFKTGSTPRTAILSEAALFEIVISWLEMF